MSERSSIFDNFIPQLKTILKAETVFGEPYQAGEVTLIPVNSVKVGFGFGGGTSAEKGGSAGEGGGGGVLLTPVAFVVIRGAEVTIHNLNNGTIENILDKAPDVIQKLAEVFSKKSNEA